MTDQQLAAALVGATNTEAVLRAHCETARLTKDDTERLAAINAMRHVTAYRKSLETWIAERRFRGVAMAASRV